jgi:O-antigen/teichoic acid export membrane protein
MSTDPQGRKKGHSILKSSVEVMTSQWLGLILRFTATLVTARMMTPEEIGYVAWIGIWPMYATWLTFGVVTGAGRLIPIRRGEGLHEEVKAIKQAAFSVTVAVMVICLLAGVLARATLTPWFDSYTRWKFASSGFLCAATVFHTYVTVLLVAAKRFRMLASKQIVDGVLWWVFLPLIWNGVAGLTIRLLLVSIVTPAIFFILIKGWAPLRIDWIHAKALCASGWIIMVVVFFVGLAYAFDRTMIAFFMDDRALGFYLLATLVVSFMRPVTDALGRVLYPHLGESYGKHGDVKVVGRMALQPMPRVTMALVPFVILGWFLVEPLTRLILPLYLPGVPACRIALLGVLFAPAFGAYVFYNVVNKQVTLTLKLVIGLLTQIAVSVFLYGRLGTLECFAYGFVAGLGTSAILITVGILRIIRGR